MVIKFDPFSIDVRRELMDRYGDSRYMYSGFNEDGERITISIFTDRIVVNTFQENGWCRINTYHRDGSREETYER